MPTVQRRPGVCCSANRLPIITSNNKISGTSTTKAVHRNADKMFPLFPGNNLHVISGFLQEKSEGNRNMHDVVIEHLSFSYSEGGRLILEDINLEVSAGEFVCLLGQSGCGKSTLLRLLAGLEKPTSGQIKIGDKVLKGADLERSVVFQDYGLFPWMTAGENILLAPVSYTHLTLPTILRV